MRDRFEGSATGAIASAAALAAALIVSSAQAGDIVSNRSLDSGPSAAACGGEACARISGYIKAGSDVSDSAGSGPARLAPQQRLFAGSGAAVPPTSDAPSRGWFFLDVGHDDSAR